PVAERSEQAPVPAIPRIEERAAGPPAIRLVEGLHDLILGLGDVAVGVDDGHGLTPDSLPRGRVWRRPGSRRRARGPPGRREGAPPSPRWGGRGASPRR